MVETGLNSVVVNGRGKLPRFTQACGNRRFTTSDDAGARGIPGSPIRRREWPARSGLRSCSWAILRVLVGLWRGTAFHPATRVAVPEAFLARRICVVHQLARAEEPAQRPGSPLGCVLGWVLDMGFRLCHGTRSSRLQRSSAALWRSTPGLPESYWASRGDAAPGAIAGVEGKRIRTPGAVE